jgi:hypothetical protein
MNDPTCVKTISAIMTLTLPKLSAATMIPQIAAPRRTIRQPQYPKTPRGPGGCDVLAQKIHNLKNPECRPQVFINQADASKRKKNNTIKITLGTPLEIRNTILVHKIPQLAEDLRKRTPFYIVHWRCWDCWAVRLPYTRNVIRSLVLNKSQRPIY